MREIEFRGKRIDNGEWTESSFIMIDKKQELLSNEVELFYADKWRAVIPETLGQYTGLKDKNGKKIFEGDILSSLYKDDGCMGVYVITFDNGAFYPKRYGKYQQIYVMVSMTDLKWCEVIGNIHDNPELLEVEDVKD